MKPLKRTIVKFFKTTTLHGFKYLISRYCNDRIGWALCCLASVCCSGVLCIVLWERFQGTPALLQLREIVYEDKFQSLPIVALCQPVEKVAEAFLEQLNDNGTDTSRIPATLVNALLGKNTDEAEIDNLESLLAFNNASLLELLWSYTPDCSQILRRCRWRDVTVDCVRLFRKELTSSGVCCVATPTRFSKTFTPVIQRLDVIKKFDIAIQCVQGPVDFGFLVYYFGEEWTFPILLSPGFNYQGHLTFIAEKDHDEEKLLGTCVSDKEYSRGNCLLKCTEKICGCSDPFRKLHRKENEEIPPPCSIKRLCCLRTFGLEGNTTCSCLPACQKILAKLVIEKGSYKLIQTSLDPIYSGLNVTHSLILRLRMNIGASKLFWKTPTETWLTLLSSLGGVFNMFLGVGLFSALEFLFLIFVQIPKAVRRSTEVAPAPTNTVLFK